MKPVLTCQTVASYIRVSTEDQEREGFSLQNQDEANLAFIRQKFGSTAQVLTYKDVESGFSVERKNYLRLLKDCETRRVEAVVVWRLDRFTRNTSAGLAALNDLTVRWGVPVYSVTEGKFDFNDPNNKLISTFLVGMAEFERNRIMQRVMPGMKKGVQLGHYQGARYPFWGTEYNKRDQKLKWVDTEVKGLQLLFEWVASGSSVISAAKRLYELGYRNRRGNPLTTTVLCNAIRREFYCDGYIRWNGIISEKPVLEPIIERPIWEKANQVMESNRSPAKGRRGGARRDDSRYVLQGVLKCKYCNGNLYGHLGRLSVRYYVCSTRFSRTSAVCKGQYIKADAIEAAAFEVLKKIVNTPYLVELAREDAVQSVLNQNPAILAEVRLAERKVRELKTKHVNFLNLHLEGVLTKEQFIEDNNYLIQQQQTAEKNLVQLREKLRIQQEQNQYLNRTFEVLAKFEKVWESLDFKGKKSLYNCVFAKAHADSLGWHDKDKRLVHYLLKEPFASLAKGGGIWAKIKNASKIQQDRYSIQSLPMAVK